MGAAPQAPHAGVADEPHGCSVTGAVLCLARPAQGRLALLCSMEHHQRCFKGCIGQASDLLRDDELVYKPKLRQSGIRDSALAGCCLAAHRANHTAAVRCRPAGHCGAGQLQAGSACSQSCPRDAAGRWMATVSRRQTVEKLLLSIILAAGDSLRLQAAVHGICHEPWSSACRSCRCPSSEPEP